MNKRKSTLCDKEKDIDTLSQDWNESYDELDASMEARIDVMLSSGNYKLCLRALDGLPVGSRILEAGCGVGQWVFQLSSLGFEAHGIDISGVAIQKSKEAAKRHEKPDDVFVVGDLRDMPYPDGMFDLIVSWGVIEHFADPLIALQEFYRVLKDGGRVLVTTPNLYCFHGLIGRHVLNLTKSRKLGYVGYEDQYTPKKLVRLFDRTDFRVEESGLFQTGLVFGTFWQLIPIIGKPVFEVLGKFGNYFEKHTSLIGAACYVLGFKDSILEAGRD